MADKKLVTIDELDAFKRDLISKINDSTNDLAGSLVSAMQAADSSITSIIKNNVIDGIIGTNENINNVSNPSYEGTIHQKIKKVKDDIDGNITTINSKLNKINLEGADGITITNNSATFHNNKALTLNGSLAVGDSNNTGNITIKAPTNSNNNLTLNTDTEFKVENSNSQIKVNNKTLTLTGSANLSGITINGTGTLNLNKNLTIEGNGGMTVIRNISSNSENAQLNLSNGIQEINGTKITFKKDTAQETYLDAKVNTEFSKDNSENSQIIINGKTLKLTGSPTLSGITTTGTGILNLNKNFTISTGNVTLTGGGASTNLILPNASTEFGTTEIILNSTDSSNKKTLTLNKNLTVDGANKTITGSASSITLNKNLTVSGTQGKTITGSASSITLDQNLTVNGSGSSVELTNNVPNVVAKLIFAGTTNNTITLNSNDNSIEFSSKKLTLGANLTTGIDSSGDYASTNYIQVGENYKIGAQADTKFTNNSIILNADNSAKKTLTLNQNLTATSTGLAFGNNAETWNIASSSDVEGMFSS